MKKIKLRVSLILITFVLFTIINSVGALGFFKELEKSIDNILTSNHESVLASGEMQNILEQEQKEIIGNVLDKKKSNISFFEKNFLIALEKGLNNITEEGEEELLKEIEKKFSFYRGDIQELLKVEKNEKLDYYYKNILPKYIDLKEELKNLADLNQKYIVKMKEKSEDLAIKARYYSLTITLLICIIGVFFIKYLLNKILNPIEDLSTGIKEISNGNLEYKIPLKREKEINFILREFNKMADKLNIYEKMNVNQLLKEGRKSEAIIESMDSPILVTDSKNKIVLINKSMKGLFYLENKNVINKPFLEIIKNNDIFNIIKKSRENILEDEYLGEIEIFNKEKRYFKIIANQILFNEKENIGTVILMQDITKFKEIDKLKTDLLNTISHEFRTPLTSIAMAVDMLLLDKNSEEEEEFLNIIKDEGENLNKLVSELLLLSKLETGKIEMRMKDVSLEKICMEVKNKFKLQLNEKEIELNLKIDNISIYCDKEKINWVLSNLVGNAIRYTERKGKIEIESNDEGRDVIIKVRDWGRGIEEKDLNQIFNKFFQTGENEGSAGLGLSICKEIIKEHSGEIGVESKINEGSTFFFYLRKSIKFK